jgi:hypothetical protein
MRWGWGWGCDEHVWAKKTEDLDEVALLEERLLILHRVDNAHESRSHRKEAMRET